METESIKVGGSGNIEAGRGISCKVGGFGALGSGRSKAHAEPMAEQGLAYAGRRPGGQRGTRTYGSYVATTTIWEGGGQH
jgi:hypothetical protein